MFAYWLMFAGWGALAIQFARRRSLSRIPYVALVIVSALIVGLRFRVGGDWFNYLNIYDSIYFQPLPVALTMTDPAYALLNWLSAQLDLGIWPVNLACGVIFMVGLARLAVVQPNPALALLVAVPYLIIVVAMGYTRQAAAIGIICYVLSDASEKHPWRQIILVGVAALFHKSAILVLPIMLIPIFRRNIALGILGGIVFVSLFSVVLASASDRLITNYVAANLDSEGALVRVSMNVVAAVLLFAFRSRFGFDKFMLSYWTVNAVLAISSLAALALLSASTAVDRLALFLIPLQVVVFARLPYALSGTGRPLPSVLLGVIAYSFLVQFVWLNYAANAESWVPYATLLSPEA